MKYAVMAEEITRREMRVVIEANSIKEATEKVENLEPHEWSVSCASNDLVVMEIKRESEEDMVDEVVEIIEKKEKGDIIEETNKEFGLKSEE